MDTRKSHGFFLASFLVLMFLGDLTEACTSCPEISLRDACCTHDFVMRIQFMNVKQDSEFPIRLNMFTIRSIQVFKGPKSLKNTWILYSPEVEDYCGYHHQLPFRGDDYLISGLIDDVGLQINKCHLAKPWSEVPLVDQIKLGGLVGKDCSIICARE